MMGKSCHYYIKYLVLANLDASVLGELRALQGKKKVLGVEHTQTLIPRLQFSLPQQNDKTSVLYLRAS